MFGNKGLVQIYTGNGKGKTTAALGLALRASGQGAKVIIIQFMKGWEHYGELKAVQSLAGVTLIQTGRPDYVYRGQETDTDYSEASKGLALAKEHLTDCDLLILDEINVALDYDLIRLNDVIELVKSKPESLEMVLTGRAADESLIELADLVTEKKEVKHPYQKGIEARRGVEF